MPPLAAPPSAVPSGAAGLGWPLRLAQRLVKGVGDGAAKLRPGGTAARPRRPGRAPARPRPAPGAPAGRWPARSPRAARAGCPGWSPAPRGPAGPVPARPRRLRPRRSPQRPRSPPLASLRSGSSRKASSPDRTAALCLQRPHLGEPGPGGGPPVGERAEAQLIGQLRVAGNVPRVQQAERHPHVAAGHPAGIGRAADGVIQPGTRVPDRVPDAVRQRRDSLPGSVQEQDVEIAAWQQFAPPVSADGYEGHPRVITQTRGQPPVGGHGPPFTVGRERGEAPGRGFPGPAAHRLSTPD